MPKENTKEGRPIETKLRFNTEDGIATYETEFIKGKLNAIIIDSMDKISVTIDSLIGYQILHLPEHLGVKYYAPRAVLRGPILYGIVNDQFNKFKLNEPLDIRISGPKNKEVTIILRYD